MDEREPWAALRLARRRGRGYTQRSVSLRTEPVVRIRCPPEEEARCLAALARSGFTGERVLTWVVVRNAPPDAVNEALVSGAAGVRVAARERIGQLVGWLLDRAGRLDGKAVNLEALVSRAIEDAGLTARYRPRAGPELLAAARVEHERLLDSGAGMLRWDEFVDRFCALKEAPPVARSP